MKAPPVNARNQEKRAIPLQWDIFVTAANAHGGRCALSARCSGAGQYPVAKNGKNWQKQATERVKKARNLNSRLGKFPNRNAVIDR
ncbi:hypothetical protein [Oceanicella actignis]|uniref:hypothetical protein n=1 Tax=Oceanicella actignis TaxID=1189325 RepID=UPI0011E855F0|nr:hypothetical protein [Oceanicella actignis]